MLDIQEGLVGDIVTDYQDDAYGPSVDRIAEQQLIATGVPTAGASAVRVYHDRQIADLLLLSYLDAPEEAGEEAEE